MNIKTLSWKKERDKYDYYWFDNGKEGNEVSNLVIEPAIIEAEIRFGLSVKKLDKGDMKNQFFCNQVGSKSAYVLAGPVDVSFVMGDLSIYQKLFTLAKSGIKVNIIPSIKMLGREVHEVYRDGLHVREYDSRYFTNHIFPDFICGDYLTVSPLDIISNIACETFRVKVDTKFHNTEDYLNRLVEKREGYAASISKLAKIVSKYQLFDRAATDGMIYISTKEKSGLVTHSNTDKCNIDMNDFCLVHGYDLDSRLIKQTGTKRHSSDVELIEVGMHIPEKSLIHLHTPNKMVSRGWIYPELSTSREIPYGEFGHLNYLLSERKRIETVAKTKGIMNLLNHGLVFFVDDPEEIEEKIRQYPAIVEKK